MSLKPVEVFMQTVPQSNELQDIGYEFKEKHTSYLEALGKGLLIWIGAALIIFLLLGGKMGWCPMWISISTLFVVVIVGTTATFGINIIDALSFFFNHFDEEKSEEKKAFWLDFNNRCVINSVVAFWVIIVGGAFMGWVNEMTFTCALLTTLFFAAITQR